MAIDYYELLGVSPDASSDEIKKAFRRLARELHPDATGNDAQAAERYKQVSEAYAVLSDPHKRQRYDMARSNSVFGGSPFSSTIEDIFDSFFGAGTARPRERGRARAGESLEVACELSFREAVFGGERTLTYTRSDPCGTCGGEGTAPGTYPERCPSCEGTGQIQQVRRTVLGSLVTAVPCHTCRQSGWVVPNPCGACAGSGRVTNEVDLPLDIPPGIETGDRLRVRGEGDAGAAGGPRGDLYVRFVVETDERFSRSGEDLVTWAEIPMTVAALGGEVVFESLDGTERLEIPPGTQSGEVFRIRGRGGVGRGTFGERRGDLVVRARVLTPTDLAAEEQELLRRLAEIRGEDASDGKGLFGRLRRAFGMEE